MANTYVFITQFKHIKFYQIIAPVREFLELVILYVV